MRVVNIDLNISCYQSSCLGLRTFNYVILVMNVYIAICFTILLDFRTNSNIVIDDSMIV